MTHAQSLSFPPVITRARSIWLAAKKQPKFESNKNLIHHFYKCAVIEFFFPNLAGTQREKIKDEKKEVRNHVKSDFHECVDRWRRDFSMATANFIFFPPVFPTCSV